MRIGYMLQSLISTLSSAYNSPFRQTRLGNQTGLFIVLPLCNHSRCRSNACAVCTSVDQAPDLQRILVATSDKLNLWQTCEED